MSAEDVKRFFDRAVAFLVPKVEAISPAPLKVLEEVFFAMPWVQSWVEKGITEFANDAFALGLKVVDQVETIINSHPALKEISDLINPPAPKPLAFDVEHDLLQALAAAMKNDVLHDALRVTLGLKPMWVKTA